MNLCPCAEANSPAVASHFVARYRDSEIRACDRCGLGFTAVPPAEIPYEENDFHQMSLKAEGQKEENRTLPSDWKNALDISLRMIQQVLPQGGTVLDIGCGEGVFLEQVRNAGYEAIGLEPSLAAALRGRERGLQILQGRFESDKCYPKADLVVMAHVLEHIHDFKATLAKVAEVAPGGYLLLMQTNYRGWIPTWYPNRWYAWVPQEHFWHFTPDSLTLHAKESGFRRVDCRYSSLVHERWKYRMLSRLAGWIPGASDQFHLLLKHDATGQ
jgi:SAM-dependent methyltransferase